MFFYGLGSHVHVQENISLQSPISALNFLCCYVLAKVAFTGMKRCISSQISLEFAFTSRHICKNQVNPGQDAVAEDTIVECLTGKRTSVMNE